MSKKALITGASRGIGKAIALGMSHTGFDIIAVDLESQESELNALRDEIESDGRTCRIAFTDVCDAGEIESLMNTVECDFGSLDVLVNNAGVLSQYLVEDLDDDEWDRVMAVNAKGTFMMTKAIIPIMKQQGKGSIINIASIGGKKGAPLQAHYCSSKAAVIEFTRVLAMELGEFNIRVNAVCPGIIMTEMGKNNLKSKEKQDYWVNSTALKRLGDPEDVVGTVKFFASDDSAFITGQSLNVCGGIIFY